MREAFAALVLAALPAQADQIGPERLDTLPEAEVLFLGEVHGNPVHHDNQRRAIAALQPAALVFEMLTEAQVEEMPGSLPAQDELATRLGWDESGWPDFALYYPLFTAAPAAQVFGAGLPRDAARMALTGELGESFGTDAPRFGLDTPLPPAQQAAREGLQARAHCDALPDDMLPGMVSIQRLRDAMLARAALRALDATGGPVAVITGTGHARTDWGAPHLLHHAAPHVSALSIGQFEAKPDTAPPFDFWVVTDPHPGPDPCAAFR